MCTQERKLLNSIRYCRAFPNKDAWIFRTTSQSLLPTAAQVHLCWFDIPRPHPEFIPQLCWADTSYSFCKSALNAMISSCNNVNTLKASVTMTAQLSTASEKIRLHQFHWQDFGQRGECFFPTLSARWYRLPSSNTSTIGRFEPEIRRQKSNVLTACSYRNNPSFLHVC